MNYDDTEPDVLSESEHFAIWRSAEEEDVIYHVELGGVTLHLNSEEWEEFVVLVKSALKK